MRRGYKSGRRSFLKTDINQLPLPMADKELDRKFFQFYLFNIPTSKIPLFKKLFKDWAQSPRKEDHQKLFDVACHHENKEVRAWTIEQIKNWSLANYWEDYIEWWIRNPVTHLEDLILYIIEEKQDLITGKGLISAAFLLLNRDKDAHKIDHDYFNLENLIQTDPLILGPLAERISDIRKRDFYYIIGSRAIILNYDTQEVTESSQITLPLHLEGLWKTLRSGDWDQAWHILISSSFICLVENFLWLARNKWKPKLKEEADLFEIIMEFVGENGWSPCEDIIYHIIEMDNPINLKEKGLNIKIINNAVFANPNLFDFDGDYSNIQIGRFYTDINQTHYFTIKINEMDCILISFPNQLIEYLNIEMISDEFHLVLEQINLCISKIAICSLFMPLFQLTKLEFEWVKNKFKFLSDVKDENNRKILRVIYVLFKIQQYHGYKKFNLTPFEANRSSGIDEIRVEPEKSNGNEGKIEISLGIDFGNTKTAVTALNLRNFQIISGKALVKENNYDFIDIEREGFTLPSLIHFKTSSDWFIGKGADELWASQQTFKEMKKNLRNAYRDVIRVKGRNIFAPQAAKLFLHEVLKLINLERYAIKKIGIAYPLTAPVDYVTFLKEVLREFLQKEKQDIFIIDEASAASIGLANEVDPSKQIFVLDIGGGTTDLSILKFEEIKSEGIKARIFSKDSNEIGGMQIDISIYNNLVEGQFNDSIDRAKILWKIRDVKEKISQTKKDQVLKVSNSKKIQVSLSMIEDFLRKDHYYEHLEALIERNIKNALNRGASKEIGTVLLIGGGCQWPQIKNMVQNILGHEISLTSRYNPFAVSKGIAKAAVGLHIASYLLQDIGIFNISGYRENFQVLLEKGDPYPSITKYYVVEHFSPTGEVELIFMRHWVKLAEKGIKSLQFDHKGQPSIIEHQSYEYFEPLGEPLKFNIKNKLIGIRIDQNARLLLGVCSSESLKLIQSHVVGNIL